MLGSCESRRRGPSGAGAPCAVRAAFCTVRDAEEPLSPEAAEGPAPSGQDCAAPILPAAGGTPRPGTRGPGWASALSDPRNTLPLLLPNQWERQRSEPLGRRKGTGLGRPSSSPRGRARTPNPKPSAGGHAPSAPQMQSVASETTAQLVSEQPAGQGGNEESPGQPLTVISGIFLESTDDGCTGSKSLRLM